MWKKLQMTYAKNLGLLILLVLIINLSCTVSPTVQQQSNQTTNTENTNISQLKRHEIVFQQPKIKWGYFEQIRPPIEVKDVKIVETGQDKGDLRIEMWNISNKPIIAAMFVLEPPNCKNFAMHGLLNIGWGDISLLGKPPDVVRNDKSQILKPDETGFVIYKRKELESFLHPKDYKGCASEKSYATLGQTFFRFEDGSEWRVKDEVDKLKQ